jgi:SAM-dependent methyltransferase
VSYTAGESVFFCEEFAPDRPSGFDAELDQAVSEYGLQHGVLTGRCNVAGRPATFSLTDPNLRENVTADVSGTTARHRLLACGLSLALFGTPLVSFPATAEVINARRSRVFLTETTTPFHAAAKTLLAPDLLVTSEYFGPEYASGDFVNAVRHEDLQQTSFPDAYFDLIITSDVMEHVPDAAAAEREIVRILQPGGAYCFTVPLLAYAESDMILAQPLADGTIEYLAEPIYHGDPLRAEGALVFRLFSVAEMTARFANLGTTCTTYRIWSKTYGILGPGCWVHVVRKGEPG